LAIEEIFTIGHSTHEPEAFLALLRRFEIGLLADVRRYPGSRRLPHFNARELERLLSGRSMDYVHLPELGGRRSPLPDSPNGGWRSGQFQGYADHMASEEFQAALERLLQLGAERRVAVMCAEAQWWRCHRRLLSDALLTRGARVVHIDSRGDSERHQITDFALVDERGVTYPPAQGTLEL
jgi:uncharacterized protein (DUF488 family)